MNESELQARIRRRIEQAGGWLPFDRYMEAALYEPGLGYYERAEVFGEAGDFVTASDLGPWLALALADLAEWSWERLGRPSGWILVEQGGGAGRLMRAVLEELARRGLPMPAVLMIERSARLRAMQRKALQHAPAEAAFAADVAGAADALAAGAPVVLFSNELPDAFPVRCFRCEQPGGGGVRERGVAWEDGRFVWRSGEPLAWGDGQEAPCIAEEVRAAWPAGYASEWNPQLAPWQRDLASLVSRGFVFTVDYGYSASEYYREGRIEGTLMGHRAHRVIEDVLDAPPGACDITAHVDFTALARAARAAGFTPMFWMTQGAWLAQSPSVQALVRELAASPTRERMAAMAAARRLMMPEGMGEQFKIFGQARGVAAEPPGWLAGFDRLARLGG